MALITSGCGSIRTALHYVALNGRADLAAMLLQAGADPVRNAGSARRRALGRQGAGGG